MRKNFLLPLAILFIHTNTKAQLYKPLATSTAFTESLTSITQDFQNNFYRIQGKQLPSQEDMDVYESAVSIPGAKHCVIYRFHSKEDTTASWQGTMYEGDNYNEAVKVYRNTCRSVDKSNIKLQGGASTGFAGKTELPDANLRFVSSSFKLKLKDPVYDKFYAEVELVNINFDQWEVHLNLLNKKDDEDKQ